MTLQVFHKKPGDRLPGSVGNGPRPDLVQGRHPPTTVSDCWGSPWQGFCQSNGFPIPTFAASCPWPLVTVGTKEGA